MTEERETWEKRRFVYVPRNSLFGKYGPEAETFYKLAIPRKEPLVIEDDDDDRDSLYEMYALPEWLIDQIIADHNRFLGQGSAPDGMAYHIAHRHGPLLKTDCRWCGQEPYVFDWALEAYHEGFNEGRRHEI